MELSAEEIALLRRHEAFAVFERESDFAAFAASAHVETLEPATFLFEQEEPAECAYVVVEGVIAIMVATPSAENGSLLDILGAGQMFGETGLFDAGRCLTSAQSVTAARVIAIPGSALRRALGRSAALRRKLLSMMSVRLRALVRQLADLTLRTGPQRLAAFLLGLAGPVQGETIVALACERRVIAGMLGMTPESLSRAFQALRAVGVAGGEERSSVRIADVEALRRYLSAEGA